MVQVRQVACLFKRDLASIDDRVVQQETILCAKRITDIRQHVETRFEVTEEIENVAGNPFPNQAAAVLTQRLRSHASARRSSLGIGR
jgi:hypothetical protein